MRNTLFIALIWWLAGCATTLGPFRERTQSGLPTRGKTFGATLLDADGDGRLDIFLSRHGREAHIYRNLGKLRFRRISPPSGGWPPLVDHHGSAACDFDGDGDWDVYLTVGAGKGTTEGFNHLWRKDGRVFENVAAAHPLLADSHGRGRGAMWVDLDGGPAPGLLVFNEATPPRLFAHRSHGWSDQSSRLPIAPDFSLRTACADDLDGDGATEFLLAGSENLLLTVRADASLTDVTDLAGLAAMSRDVADAALADLDGDDDPDLVVAYRDGSGLGVWRNDSEMGRLRFVALPSPDLGEVLPWSLLLDDLDNDGTVDLYVTQMGPHPMNRPNLTLAGRGDGTFDVDADSPLAADVFSGSTGAWAADFDHDGDLDLLALQGAGPSATQRGTVALYENRTTLAGITVELVTQHGPPHGLGARAWLRALPYERSQRVRSVATPYNSTIPRLHFGVGETTGPFQLEIEWAAGTRQTVTLPRAHAAYRVTEGVRQVQTLR